MYNLVDWVSFTVHVGEHSDRYWYPHLMDEKLEGMLGNTWRVLFNLSSDWKLEGGRTPYASSLVHKEGMRVYFGSPEHISVEIQGKGCDYVREHELMVELLSKVHETVSRIDIACDMETEHSPSCFVSKMASKRFRARSHISSASGETIYIGSKKSDRYARVYKYSEPHPRAKWLRCEMIFKAKEAKQVAKQVAEYGIDNVAKSAGDVYGWSHRDWKQDGEEIDLSTYNPERKSGKTVLWLISQVAPSFKKLVKEGVIENPEDFLQKHFF